MFESLVTKRNWGVTMRSMVHLLTFLGLPRVAATILATLLSETRPLSLTELSNRTGYAKSHLSTHLRYLVFNGLVNIIRQGRRTLYYARREVLTEILARHLNELRTRIDLVVRELGNNELVKTFNNCSHKLSDIIQSILSSKETEHDKLVVGR
jgi:DNA-binding transcriptional regulator GbsR (MarR family)